MRLAIWGAVWCLVVTLAEARSLRSTKSESCRCFNWADAYSQYGAVCGQALEFLHARNSRGKWVDGTRDVLEATDPILRSAKDTGLRHSCSDFFERLQGNRCVNQMKGIRPSDSDLWYSGSWCYVHSTCRNLNGGSPVPGTQLSWKGCEGKEGDGQDEPLRDMTPEALIDVSADQDLDASLLFDYAYWTSEKDAEHIDGPSLREISKSMLPTLMVPRARHMPRVVSWGSQYWTLEPNTEYKDPLHPGTFWSWSWQGMHDL